MTRLAEQSLINPRALTPASVLLWMCLAWVAIYWLTPIEMYTSPATYPYILLGGCLVGLLLGLVLFEARTHPSRPPDPDEWSLLYRVTFALGLLGIMLRIFDWAVLRGLSVDVGFFENREKIETAGASAFSMASTLLIPFTLAPYMFHAVGQRNGAIVGRSWTSIGLALLWPVLTIVIGSRSSMFMSIGMLLISRIIIFPHTSKKIIAFCVFFVVTLLYLGGLLFIARISEFGLNIEKSIKFSAFTHMVPVTSEYFRFVANLSDWGRDTVFIGTTFAQYVLHGVPEFVYLTEHYQNSEQWGGYTFSIFVRLAHALWGLDYNGNLVTSSIPRVGIYTTMFGPFFVDFGAFAPIFCLGLGTLISWTRSRVLAGEIAVLPLYVAFVMQMASAIVVNTFMSAYGIFYNLAFGAFWLAVVITRSRSRTIKREMTA